MSIFKKNLILKKITVLTSVLSLLLVHNNCSEMSSSEIDSKFNGNSDSISLGSHMEQSFKTVSGSAQNNRLVGTAGDDLIDGGAGDDELIGRNGDDILIGGPGKDFYQGNGGADQFVFENPGAYAGMDTIAKFEISKGDVIDISDLLSGQNISSSNIRNFVNFRNLGKHSRMYVLDRIVAEIRNQTNLDAQRLAQQGALIFKSGSSSNNNPKPNNPITPKPTPTPKPKPTPGGITKPPVKGKSFQLVLNDEFNGSKLNERVWTKNLVWNGGLGSSAFTSNNVYVKDGQLHMVTKKERHTAKNGRSYSYTSGLIHSMGKFSQKYGYFEAKVTLPTAYGPGFWPAFWLFPDRYPERGLSNLYGNNRRSTFDRNGKGMEIDIMEHLSNWGNTRSHTAIHWDGYGPEHKKSGKTITMPYKAKDAATRIFGAYWAPGVIIFYVDGVEVNRFQNSRVADVRLFMKLNTAVGGWNNNRIGSQTKLPATTKVDWVRVWREK